MPNAAASPVTRSDSTPAATPEASRASSARMGLGFVVTGLSCAGCAARAGRALAEVPGVQDAQVNFASHRAHVIGDADSAALARALEQAGYPAAQRTERLLFDTLSCASCVTRVRDALLAVPGVCDARINLATQTAEVDLLDGSAGPADLRAAVAAIGYPAQTLDGAGAVARPAERQRAEARAQTRRAALAGLLALPVLGLEMGAHLIPAVHHWIMATLGFQTSWLIQFVLTTLILVGPGAQFFRIGLPALWRRAPEMNSLVALGTGAAWIYSTVALFAPALLPEGTRAVYFEAAAVIVALILLGRALEAHAKGQTGAAIEALMDLAPATALRLVGDSPQEVPLEVPLADLRPGDRVLVKPGARVPLDGYVVKGQSDLDEAMLTGEPLPVAKIPDDDVTGGTINGAGALTVEITHAQGDTALDRIIAQVEAAQGARLPVQALVDRITRVFVPAVLAIALLAFAGWLLAGGGLDRALVAAVTVLIVACPCAMGLATPTSIMVGTGRAAQLGVLFRGGDGLQSAADVGLVAFDKTGTLTEGAPELVAFVPVTGQDRDSALARVAALESQSEHPVARAVLAAAPGPLPEATGVTAIVGRGLSGEVGGARLLIGNAALMEDNAIDIAPLRDLAEPHEARGDTVLFAAENGAPLALLAVADTVKPGAADAIAALTRRGIATALLSGDSQPAAEHVGRGLGIATTRGGVTPEGKVAALKEIAPRNGAAKTAFVGDGINDAPVLAAADVGIALGTGTDVAMESADVVLMRGDPRGVDQALGLARAVMRNIRQNLFWAFAYNVALLPVAAGVFAPWGLVMQPAFAGLAMALSSVFVVTNALRLKGWHGTEARP